MYFTAVARLRAPAHRIMDGRFLISTVSSLALVILGLFQVDGGASSTTAKSDQEMVTAFDTTRSIRLDHMPIAVDDLQAAEHRYRDGLGFTIKPGRLHQNSIDNVHIKFADSSALELITASEPSDGVAARYLEFLQSGDGGAFVSFDGGAADSIAVRLRAGGMNPHVFEGGYANSVTFDFEDPLSYFFFIEYHRRPRDGPEILNHPNSAIGLYAVWLMSDDFDLEDAFLTALGAGADRTKIFKPPLDVEGQNVELSRGHLYLFPSDEGKTTPRKIVGATISVDDLRKAQESVEALYGKSVPVHESPAGKSIYVDPEFAHGIWLEFLEHDPS